MSAGSGLERPFELNAGVATLRFEADHQRFDGGSHLHGYKARLSQWRAFSAERLATTRRLDPHSRIQRWTRLAFRPLARARPATETPGSRQAETTDCLTASLCVRRLRRGITTSIVSTIELDGHDLQWDKQTAEGGFAGGLELGGEISAGASHGLCREPREARACSIRCAPVRGFQPRHP